MGSRKTAHVRVDKEIIKDFNKEYPGVKHTDLIRISWQQYKTVQKMGKFVYGNVWKKPKK